MTTGLAHRAFLLLHDPFTGRPAVRRGPLERALMAAQVADLLLAGRLGSRISGIDGVAGPRPPPDAPLDGGTRLVLGVLAARGGMRCPRIPAQLRIVVADELVAGGVVRRERAPWLVAVRPERFPAVDLVRAARPRMQVGRALRAPARADLATALLGALAGAVDATGVLETDLPGRERRRAVAALAERLPPALRTAVAAATSLDAAHGLVEPPGHRRR